MPTPPPAVDGALARIADENARLASAAVADDRGDLARAVDLLGDAPRVFVHGAGRSGLALRMVAMRLMHLGRTVHVVGETTTPAIGGGDLLLTASGSGTTAGVVHAAETATRAGAHVLSVSTTRESPLAALSTAVVVMPAAHKTDRSQAASAQYAGSLFEQGVLLLGDALFHTLWQRDGRSADDLWPRHANLE
jgi:6-phospho-3-hexuloisomerase